jgi:chromosome segregation ATPase
MGTTMEARKKGGPFLPKWQKVKSSHKALGGKLFQPDITATINRYDQTLTDYDALMKEQEKLKVIISDMMKVNREAAGEIADFNSQLAQLSAKMKSATSGAGATLEKYAGGAQVDLQSVKDALNSVVTAGEDYINKRKQLFTDIDGTAYGNLNKFKKVRDDFASQAASAEAQMSKLESEANNAESAIMSAIQDYIGIADDADHPEIVKSLKGLKV